MKNALSSPHFPRFPRASLVGLLLVPALSGGFAPVAAADTFLVAEGIEGSSRDQQFENAVELLSFSWGISRDTDSMRRSTAAQVEDLSFIHFFDKASPEFIGHALNGAIIPEANLYVRKEGEIPFVYLQIALRDVVVSGVEIASGESPDQVAEHVTLSFGQICVIYTEQDETGSPGQPEETCWDVEENSSA